jgi:alpha-tubulin suppressor-like RCC1 family protein
MVQFAYLVVYQTFCFFLIDSTNEVYAWGNNNSGCLGIGATKKKYFVHPEPVISNWRSVTGQKKTPQTLLIDNMPLTSHGNPSLHSQQSNSLHDTLNVVDTITFIDVILNESYPV